MTSERKTSSSSRKLSPRTRSEDDRLGLARVVEEVDVERRGAADENIDIEAREVPGIVSAAKRRDGVRRNILAWKSALRGRTGPPGPPASWSYVTGRKGHLPPSRSKSPHGSLQPGHGGFDLGRDLAVDHDFDRSTPPPPGSRLRSSMS